jgi:hypothetical protein
MTEFLNHMAETTTQTSERNPPVEPHFWDIQESTRREIARVEASMDDTPSKFDHILSATLLSLRFGTPTRTAAAASSWKELGRV